MMKNHLLKIFLLLIVQNSGNTTLTNIAVTDNPTESISCPKTTLTAGESIAITGIVEEFVRRKNVIK